MTTLPSVIKNLGKKKGWLVVDGDVLLGWARLKREATSILTEYRADPEAWKTRRLSEDLELSAWPESVQETA